MARPGLKGGIPISHRDGEQIRGEYSVRMRGQQPLTNGSAAVPRERRRHTLRSPSTSDRNVMYRDKHPASFLGHSRPSFTYYSCGPKEGKLSGSERETVDGIIWGG